MSETDGFVEFDIKNSVWKTPARYSNLNVIGNGAFSLVW